MKAVAERAHVSVAQLVKLPVDPRRVTLVGIARAQQFGSHHGRERDGDDAGDEHRACQREGELPEERAGEAAHDADGGIHGDEGDRHGDQRPEELPRAVDGGLERREPLL